MPPQKKVMKINFQYNTCRRIIIASGITQVKFRQLRGEVVQFFPFRARLAGLSKIICGTVG
jgi:hypothetical protein